MRARYAVVFTLRRNRGWTSQVVTRRGTARRAISLAERLGDRHPDLRITRYQGRRPRSGFEVRDLRTYTLLWEHPGVIVPSVGELGYW